MTDIQKMMVVVAHPDDELLGPGATLHRFVEQSGVSVHVVILGEGLTSREDKKDPGEWKEKLDIHRKNIGEAQKEIGYQSLSLHQFPDNRFDSVDLLDIIKVVEKEKEAFGPDLIMTHHGGDLNVDHRRTFEAVMTAVRPMKGETVKSVLTFETPSGTEWRASTDPKHFIPNWFVEIRADDLEAKCRGMECYSFEKREYPHPRSRESLTVRARYWGTVVGCEFAEAFCLVRNVVSV